MAHPEIDALIGRFFACFDNRDGRRPPAPDLYEVFLPSAVVCQYRNGQWESCDPAGFVEPRIRLLTDGSVVGFHEWEVASTTDLVGPAATRLSRYEKAGSLNGADCGGKGTKLFQLVRGPAGWRIAALSWFDELPAVDRATSNANRSG